MADDSPAQPLPRRAPSSNRQAPGGKQRPAARPAALSEDALQRIREALDSVRGEASRQERPPRAERPASLPRRTPGAGKGPQPPAVIARPRLPSLRPSLPRPPVDEAPTDELPALGTSYSGSNAEEITARPDARPERSAAQPWPGTARPVDSPQAPAPQPPARDQPDRHDGTDGAAALPENPPDHRENEQVRRAKEPARRTKRPVARTKASGRRAKASGRQAKASGRQAKALAPASRPAPKTRPSRLPKPARREAPGTPGEPMAQMALLFPEEPAPEEATVRPSAFTWPQWARWDRPIAWLVLALVLVAAGPIALLLAR
jgi:hypothetical protein